MPQDHPTSWKRGRINKDKERKEKMKSERNINSEKRGKIDRERK
jgi:hypothetical protein